MENHENLDMSHKNSITDVVSQVFSILFLEPTIGMLIGLGDFFLS
jgi:hypothetical protein